MDMTVSVSISSFPRNRILSSGTVFVFTSVNTEKNSCLGNLQSRHPELSSSDPSNFKVLQGPNSAYILSGCNSVG